MSEDLSCIWRSTDEPRAIRNRHEDDCQGGDCRGCLQCPEHHCVCCGMKHVDQQTCPSCVAEARYAIADIEALYRQLPAQAVYGGGDGRLEAARPLLGGEAMVLMGPGSNGRAVAWARERGDDVSHLKDERIGEIEPPEHMLVTWEDDWRSVKHMPADPDERATLTAAAIYLDEHLSWAAQNHGAFDAFLIDMRKQVKRLEDVLHDGERAETGAPCWQCGTTLERVCHPRKGLQDEYKCARCKRSYKGDQYRYIVGQEAKAQAVSLPAVEMAERFEIKPERIRQWAKREQVAKMGMIGNRALYSIADVEKMLAEDASNHEDDDAA